MSEGMIARISLDISDFERNMERVKAMTDTLSSKFIGIGKRLAPISAILSGVGIASFKMASDVEDAIGATEQVFGENAKIVQEWASSLDSSYGIAKNEALEYSNLMGTMLINIGNLTKDEAQKQSTELIKLAGDLTAMFGGSTSEAVNALVGSLRGNNIMLNKYGIAINDVMVKQKALEMGLTSSTSEISLQAKQAATLALVWEQSASAQGQAAREASSSSGVLRALGTEIKNLSIEIGEVLSPIITPIVERIKDLISSFKNLSPELKKTIVVIGGIVAAASTFALSLGGLIKLLPLIGAGFTALTSPISLVIAAVSAAAILIIKNWDSIKAYFTTGGGAKTFDSIVMSFKKTYEFLKITFQKIKKIFKTYWDWIKDFTKESWGTAFQYIMDVVNLFVNAFNNSLDVITKLLNGDFKGAFESFKKYWSDIWNDIKTIFFNQIGGITSSMGKFLQMFGMEKWGKSLSDWGDSIKVVSAEVSSAIETTKEKTEELKNELKETKLTFDELSEEAERSFNNINEAIQLLTAELKEAEATITAIGRGDLSFTISQFEELEQKVSTLKATIDSLDKSKIRDVEKLVNDVFDRQKPTVEIPVTLDLPENVFDELEDELLDLRGNLVDIVGDVMTSITDAFANGGNVAKAAGATLLAGIGAIMMDLGKMTLLAGKAITAVSEALKSLNGPIAIAAGVALLGVGAMFKAGASRLGNSMGTAGYSGSSSSSSLATVTPISNSEYRGSYKDDYTVEFKIGTNELVGVLDTANQRKNRL